MSSLGRRTAIILLEILAAFVLLLTLGVGAVVWKIHQGPMNADFALEYIEPLLNTPGAALTFEIGGVTLERRGADGRLVVSADDVHAISRDGEEVFSIPLLEAHYEVQDLSAAVYRDGLAAFQGRSLTPRLLVLSGPRIRLVRTIGGPVRIAAPAPGETVGGSENAIDVSIIDGFLAGDATSRGLEGLVIDGATMVLDDLSSNVRWIADEARMRLGRTGAGISLTGDLALRLGDETVRVAGDAVWIKSTKRLDVDISLDPVSPASVAAKLPQFKMLETVTIPVSGMVRATLGTDLAPRDFEAELSLAPGEVTVPEFYADPLEVQGGRISGTWSRGAGGVVTLRDLDLGGPVAEATATLSPALEPGGPAVLDVAAIARNIPVERLAGYWPEPMAPNARQWVASNLSEGIVDKADLTISGGIDLSSGDFTLTKLEGEGDFRNVSVEYIQGMPQVTGVDGRVGYTDTSVAIATRSGRIPGLALSLTEGDIELVDLVTDLPRAVIELSVLGPVRDALRLIDYEPLRYPSKLGLVPEDVSGQAATRVALDFPLLARLRLEEIGIGTAANISGASFRGVPFGEGITDGDLQLSLDGLGMTIKGTAQLSGAPVSFAWAERFAESNSRRVEGKATVTGRTLSDLGAEIAPYGAGVAEVTFDYRDLPDRISVIHLDGDLSNMQLRLPGLEWQKAPGEPAQFKGTLQLKDNRIAGIDALSVTGDGLDIAGQINFDAELEVPQRMTLERLILGETDLSAEAEAGPDGWTVVVRGRQIDLSQQLEEEGDGAFSARVETESPFLLDVSVDRLLLNEGRVLDGFSANLRHDGARWGKIRAEGRPNGLGRLTFDALPLTRGHNILVNATDAGATLRWLDLMSSLEGGVLTIDGTADLDAPELAVDARMRVDRFRIVRAPAALQVLRLVSLTGLFEALSTEGIPFVRFDVDIAKTGSEVTMANGRGVGRSLGFQVEGQLTDEDDQVELKGLLVPAYTLNNAIGSIPLVGPLITGGEGEGLIATRFYVTGTAEEPTVSVDPLQSLAPGFLRNVFGYFIDGAGSRDREQVSFPEEPIPGR